MSQLKRGALLSYTTIFLTTILGLVLTPYIIQSLGNAEYGLYTLLGAFVGYFTLVDFGLGDTIVRYVARYRAQDNKFQEAVFLGTAFKIYLFIVGVIFVIGVFIYQNLNVIFKQSLSFDELYKAQVMFGLLLFNLILSLLGNPFLGAINAYENFVYSKGIIIIRYVLRSITVVAVLYYGGKAISLVVVDTVFNILLLLCNMFYFFFVQKSKVTLKKAKKSEVKELLSFSVWLFLLGLVSQFQWQGGQVMLGIMANTIEVAIYSVGTMLGLYYGAFSSAITTLFLPHATKLVVSNASDDVLTNQMIKIGRTCSFILLLILSGFILFGKQFIMVWLGVTYLPSYYVAVVIMIVNTVPLVQSYANSILEAKHLVRYKSLTYIIFIVLGLIGGYFSYDRFGLIGLVSSICTGWSISIGILNLFYVKKLNLDIGRFFKEVFLRQIVVLSACMVIGYFIIANITVSEWIGLLLKVFLYSVIYSIFYYVFIFKPEEKKLLVKW